MVTQICSAVISRGCQQHTDGRQLSSCRESAYIVLHRRANQWYMATMSGLLFAGTCGHIKCNHGYHMLGLQETTIQR